MKAPDDAAFEALEAAYLRGIPRKSRAKEIADARAFVPIAGRACGGGALLGPVCRRPSTSRRTSTGGTAMRRQRCPAWTCWA